MIILFKGLIQIAEIAMIKDTIVAKINFLFCKWLILNIDLDSLLHSKTCINCKPTKVKNIAVLDIDATTVLTINKNEKIIEITTNKEYNEITIANELNIYTTNKCNEEII